MGHLPGEAAAAVQAADPAPDQATRAENRDRRHRALQRAVVRAGAGEALERRRAGARLAVPEERPQRAEVPVVADREQHRHPGAGQGERGRGRQPAVGVDDVGTEAVDDPADPQHQLGVGIGWRVFPVGVFGERRNALGRRPHPVDGHRTFQLTLGGAGLEDGDHLDRVSALRHRVGELLRGAGGAADERRVGVADQKDSHRARLGDHGNSLRLCRHRILAKSTCSWCACPRRPDCGEARRRSRPRCATSV